MAVMIDLILWEMEGDAVSSYLVEWSQKAWSEYLPTKFEIKIHTATGVEGLKALSLLSGTFQIQVDTSTSSMAAISGIYSSAFIPINTSLVMLKTSDCFASNGTCCTAYRDDNLQVGLWC